MPTIRFPSCRLAWTSTAAARAKSRSEEHSMARSRKNEKGQATLILVLALGLVLVGGMGLAIDGANLYHQQQMAQVAADAAATAAAMSIFRGNYVHSPAEVTDFPVNTSFTCTTTDTRLPCQFAR